jgi:large subunit ribosomal protein L3
MAARVAKAILGRKLGMTQIFGEDGQALPVTLLEAGPCVIVGQRPLPSDSAVMGVQLGFGEVREEKRERVNKPMAGHFKKAGVPPQRHLREFRLPAGENEPAVGDQIGVDIFAAGEKVDVSGISKGKGFAGGMKRHGFHGGPATHGSMSHRRPASSGATDAECSKGRRNRDIWGRSEER